MASIVEGIILKFPLWIDSIHVMSNSVQPERLTMGKLIGFIEIHMNVNQVFWKLHKRGAMLWGKKNVVVLINLFHGISDLNRGNESLIWLGHIYVISHTKDII